MPNSINPANARVVRDIKIYRTKIDNAAGTKAEIKAAVQGRDPANFPNPTDAQIKSIDAYRVFASFQHSQNRKFPHRLGGGLPQNPPGNLANLPPPTAGAAINWNGNAATINAQGAVVHTGLSTALTEQAHNYMHGIFDTILYTTRELLDAINVKLEAYAANVSATNAAQTEAGAYLSAVTAFNDYCASLQPNGSSPYSTAFTFVGIDPVVTNEGFIVSCRVKLAWKNPYHSSSTIAIP